MNIRLKSFFVITAVTAGVILSIKYILPIVIPFVIAFFIVLLIHPAVEKLHHKIRLNRAIITGGMILAVVGVLGAGIWMLLNKFFMQVRNIYENLNSYQDQGGKILDGFCSMSERLLGIEADAVRTFLADNIDRFIQQIGDETIPQMMSNSVGYLIYFIEAFGFAMIIFISIILLSKDFNDIKEFHKKYFYYDNLRIFGKELVKISKNYLKAQAIIMAVITVICIVGLLLLRNSYAVVVGVAIGLLDALPVIGTGFVFVPWAFYHLVQGEVFYAAVYIIIYIICSMTREFLEPKLIGKKLGIPSIMVLVSVFIGLKVYGLSGIITGPLTYLLIKELTIRLFDSLHLSLE